MKEAVLPRGVPHHNFPGWVEPRQGRGRWCGGGAALLALGLLLGGGMYCWWHLGERGAGLQCGPGECGTEEGRVCQPCLCSVEGSRWQSCNQTTGQCVCLPGHIGDKYELCSSGGCEPRRDRDADQTGLGRQCGPGRGCRVAGTVCRSGICVCRQGLLPSSTWICKPAPDKVDGSKTMKKGVANRKTGSSTNEEAVSLGWRGKVDLRTTGLAGLRTDIRFRFRSYVESSELLVAAGGRDRLTIRLQAGSVVADFFLAGANFSLTSARVGGRGWREVHLQRYRGQAVLRVDRVAVRGGAVTSLAHLQLGPILRLAGLHGCLADLQLAGQAVRLLHQPRDPAVLATRSLQKCAAHPCGEAGCRGECRARRDGAAECLCGLGHTGPRCRARRDHCRPNPCRHGGRCHHAPPAPPTCICLPGWTGLLCDTRP